MPFPEDMRIPHVSNKLKVSTMMLPPVGSRTRITSLVGVVAKVNRVRNVIAQGRQFLFVEIEIGDPARVLAREERAKDELRSGTLGERPPR